MQILQLSKVDRKIKLVTIKFFFIIPQDNLLVYDLPQWFISKSGFWHLTTMPVNTENDYR
jgi:hypothetical protein